MSRIISRVSLTDDKLAIYPIKGWDKFGNLNLGEAEEVGDWSAGDSTDNIRKPTRLPSMFVTGNKHMRGLFLQEGK